MAIIIGFALLTGYASQPMPLHPTYLAPTLPRMNFKLDD
jgi:hypothetical protein